MSWGERLPWGIRFSARYDYYRGGKNAYEFLAGPRSGDYFGPGAVTGWAEYTGRVWVAMTKGREFEARTRRAAVEGLTGRAVGSTPTEEA